MWRWTGPRREQGQQRRNSLFPLSPIYWLGNEPVIFLVQAQEISNLLLGLYLGQESIVISGRPPAALLPTLWHCFSVVAAQTVWLELGCKFSHTHTSFVLEVCISKHFTLSGLEFTGTHSAKGHTVLVWKCQSSHLYMSVQFMRHQRPTTECAYCVLLFGHQRTVVICAPGEFGIRCLKIW